MIIEKSACALDETFKAETMKGKISTVEWIDKLRICWIFNVCFDILVRNV